MHLSYQVALVARRSEAKSPYVALNADVRSIKSLASSTYVRLDQDARQAISDTDIIPFFTKGDLEPFDRIIQNPRLGTDAAGCWHCYPVSYIDWTRGYPLESLSAEPTMFRVMQTRHLNQYGIDLDEAFPKWVRQNSVGEVVRRSSTRSQVAATVAAECWRDNNPLHSLRVCFRYPSRATDQRTIIASIVPLNTLPAKGYVHWIVFGHCEWDVRCFVVGILNSLVGDWFARRIVDRHVTDRLIRALPIPRCERQHPYAQRAIRLVATLLGTDPDLTDVSAAVGVECGPLDDDERFEMICELDAVVAHLYGLTERHLHHIFETFHEGWGPGTTASHHTLGEYDRRIKTTIEHFRRLKDGS